MKQAILALADGTTFEGFSLGATGEATGEVVFNTSMTGYQEILTDPSYVDQMICMTYPEQGNYGVNRADEESARPHATGFIVRHAAEEPSSFRAEQSLHGYLAAHGIVGITGIDTRRLTRHIRTAGAQMGVIATEGSARALVERARALPGMEGQDLATRISTAAPYEWTEQGADCWTDAERAPLERPRFHVVAYDWGLKRAMLRLLAQAGCRVTVVPSRTSAAEALALRPDGVFLTNGPGDPAAVTGARETVAALLGKVPVFGICLGHQILALAIGARTYKLKFGHRGANQPVKELDTGKVDITAQNHGFAVDDASLGKRARVTHVNLNDGTVEGIEVLDAPAFSVQYHPESSPGPHDARPLFARFVAMMERSR
ncbi:glutamine-hydrolyzing carbamoyl-phosphate synthase small subunit [Anaeromyxobacter sp. PSR-1]|uniref:glutamine-hydrolyzing carbamoyl-phosphate synthase small subunit n=1 Tax=Anaeromyxobacter sp. PSR-1 TaxID=1300915 RepID=UPI0005DC779A|nr:glutamine-hydrolyzing carbamoyl-phosphate synthase small subunit [Anaeromyxobacter sp. PSR-1]GAO02845.1 carbamoyl-phosphate synthase small chain [Anaeromyxobacter sp. PSR-1]